MVKKKISIIWSIIFSITFFSGCLNESMSENSSNIIMTKKAFLLENTLIYKRLVTQQGAFWNDQKWLYGNYKGGEALYNIFNDDGKASIEVHYFDPYGKMQYKRIAIKQGRYWNDQKWLYGSYKDGEALYNVFNDGGKASIETHYFDSYGEMQYKRIATQQGDYWNDQKWLYGYYNDGEVLYNVFNDGGKASIEVHYFDSYGEMQYKRITTQQGAFWNDQKWLYGYYGGVEALYNIFNDGGKASIETHYFDSYGKMQYKRIAIKQGRYWNDQKWLYGSYKDGEALYNVFNDGGKASIETHYFDSYGEMQYKRIATQQGDYWNDQKWLYGNYKGGEALYNIFRDHSKADIEVHYFD